MAAVRVAVLLVVVALMGCTAKTPEPTTSEVLETLLAAHKAEIQAFLESDWKAQMEIEQSQMEMQRAYIAWEIVVVQERTRSWDTDDFIDEFRDAYLDLGAVEPWASP